MSQKMLLIVHRELLAGSNSYVPSPPFFGLNKPITGKAQSQYESIHVSLEGIFPLLGEHLLMPEIMEQHPYLSEGK